MQLQGSTLRHPITADRRGTLATISDRAMIVEQSIAAILETRQGERVMLPDYGIPDFIFSVMDAGFSTRLAYFVEQQIRRYEPQVDQLKVKVGILSDGSFSQGFTEDQQRAAISITFTVLGTNTPRNLIYPTWVLRPV